mmetsp:Transcript_66874/g.105623  ORF Transcript_66874/g.105623 Transcript_66874/m.105623 type:complete len:228 (+) Transcript_66874:346-1029(+)
MECITKIPRLQKLLLLGLNGFSPQVLFASHGEILNFAFSRHACEEVYFQFSTLSNCFLDVFDPLSPPTAPPWLLLSIKGNTPAAALQIFLLWDWVMAAEMLRAFWQKDHGSADIALAASCDQGIPSRFVLPGPGGNTGALAFKDGAVEDNGAFGNALHVIILFTLNVLLQRCTGKVEAHQAGGATTRQPSNQPCPPVSCKHITSNGSSCSKHCQDEECRASMKGKPL